MKGLILFFLICLPLGASAQTYQDFPLDESAEWRVNKGELYNGCWVSDRLRYFITGDTVFNGNTYFIIEFSGIRWSEPGEITIGCTVDTHAVSGLHGYMRAENGIYYEGSAQGEGVLFDFTLDIGDTLVGAYTEGFPLEIDSIDFIDVGGYNCKRLWFHENGNGSDRWILEGVGSSYGLMDAMFFFEFYNTQRCYGHNGFPLVYDDLYYCDFTVGSENISKIELIISPNPTNSILKISGLTSQTSITISSIFGKEVMCGTINETGELDVSELKKGIYILKMLRNGHSVSRKFVKQ